MAFGTHEGAFVPRHDCCLSDTHAEHRLCPEAGSAPVNQEGGMRRVLIAIAALVVAATVSTATSAFAQLGGGTLSGTITDEQGGVLPGVTVTISGSDRTTDGVSDEGGKYRFLNLAPGLYKVSLALQGFTTTIREN